MNKELTDYRNLIIAAEQKSQEDYDKTVLALSGGALGISFSFIKDVIGTNPIVNSYLLTNSWKCWGISLACVLISFFSSQRSLRSIIKSIDNDTVYKRKNNLYNAITFVLNITSGSMFILGVYLIINFVSYNMR
jgi:hypothetical protein